MQRVNWPSVSGTAWSSRRQASAMRASTSPVAMNSGSPTSMRDATGPSRSAAASASAVGRAQRRSASSSSHSPVRLRWNRTRPPTPSSLVKPASIAAGSSTGASCSTPASDQVPHEM